jgi:cell division protein FtsW
MMAKRSFDWFFFTIVGIILAMGIFFFVSAAFGVMARNMAKFSGVLFNQLVFGAGFGLIGLYIASRIPIHIWKKASLIIFAGSFILTFLVFVPGIGFEHGGAKRWIHLFGISVQPSEFLKFGAVLYMAAWCAALKDKLHDWRFGLLPLLGILGLTAIPILLQPDTGTFLILAAGVVGVFVAGGGRWRDFFILMAIGFVSLVALIFMRPYLMDRITTYMNPDDAHGSAYQIRQSLIAIGSGGLLGRGFGQSVQKFNYLPEPIGDSIFAVIAEEMGFVGGAALIIMYVLFAARGFYLASHAPDQFSALFITGIIILVVTQSLLNIGSMLAITPLTGVPLVFVSHGGTALMLALFEVGVVLGISRYRR